MSTEDKLRTVILAALVLVLLLLSRSVYGQSNAPGMLIDKRRHVEDTVWLDTQVARAGALAKLILEDVDGDGLVNCIDYSVAFKRAWDNMYGDQRFSLLVWNDRYVFNHMFVAVRSATSNVWYNIEPQIAIKNPNAVNYMMGDCWAREKYNSLYNIYDKDSWLWTKSLTNNW